MARLFFLVVYVHTSQRRARYLVCKDRHGAKKKRKHASRRASSDQLLQFPGIHVRKPRHDPALERKWMSTDDQQRYMNPSYITHTEFPVENLGSTSISTPFSSRGLSILNTANTLAITDHTDVSAKYLPTQIRRPNPYTKCSTPSGLRDPSSLRNRSGMNACGSGYLDSSRAIALIEWVLSTSDFERT